MAEDNTIIVIVGIAALALMGFLYMKSMQQQTTIALQPKTSITEFVRDENGYIKQILERG